MTAQFKQQRLSQGQPFDEVPQYVPPGVPPVTPLAGRTYSQSTRLFSSLDVDLRTQIEGYARWLAANQNLSQSPQKLQAYQKAALEIKKVGEREIRTFAPFQEQLSAFKVITPGQITALAILVACWALGFLFLHLLIFTVMVTIVTLLYISGFVTSTILAVNALKGGSGEKISDEVIAGLDQIGVEWPSYTILCPLYKEVAVVPQFVEAIKALDYPMDKLQVLFLTEENDKETPAGSLAMPLPPCFTVLVVPKGNPQTKPRACNFGLLQAKGQFVVIFDAEDKPEPYQLKKAVLTFANHGPEVACVQAKLNFYNPKQNLLTRWFTAEYSTWFDIMLPGLQRSGFSLPLGGTSNHFRTEILHALGGWDAFNVTEDCDLGLRISQYHLKTAVLDSTTYEEATSRAKVWLFQRSRWIKGYLQTYLVHMRHPLQTLQQKRLRKFFSLQIIVGAWTVVLLINPLMWALTLVYIAFRPMQLYSILFPSLALYLGAFCLVFGNFFYIYIHILGCLRRKEYSLIKWILLIPVYWIMMSISAYIAFYQLIVKPHHWEKTQHGNHLAAAAQVQANPSLSSPAGAHRLAMSSMPTTHMPAIVSTGLFKRITVPEQTRESPTTEILMVRQGLTRKLGWFTIRKRAQISFLRNPWLIAMILLACLISVASTWYSFQHHDILLYGDAYSHMLIARSVIDNITPGLGQIGGEWLPLPQLFMVPFIWNDFLWQTGLAGSIPSMICYVTTAVFLFLAAKRLTKSNIASFAGTLVFLLNPNVIYLQTSPLSECVCFAVVSMTGYFFIAWTQEDRIVYLVFTGIAAFLATLTRYDGWSLSVSIFVLAALIECIRRHRWKQIEGSLLVLGLLGSLGIILWFAWNTVIFGDPLYFLHSVYSSQSQTHTNFGKLRLFTMLGSPSGITFLPVWIISDLLRVFLGLAAVVKFLIRRERFPELLATFCYLSPISFYILSFYTGNVNMFVPGVSTHSLTLDLGRWRRFPQRSLLQLLHAWERVFQIVQLSSFCTRFLRSRLFSSILLLPRQRLFHSA